MNTSKQHQRAGTSSLEYVSVCALICIVAASGVAVLGESMRGQFVGVSNTIAANTQEEPSGGGFSSEATPGASPLLATNASVSYLQIYSALSIVCLVALGILHVSRGRKSKAEDEPQTCEVQQIKEHSKALKAIFAKRSSIRSMLLEDCVHLFEDNAQVGTYMSREVAAVRPDMSIEDADKMLREDGFRRVMVTDADGRMKGVLSRKDIACKQGKIVSDIMTSAPKTASPDMNIRIALTILLQHRISCLPVVKDGMLVGLLSTSDLLIVLQCILLVLSNQKAKAAETMDREFATTA